MPKLANRASGLRSLSVVGVVAVSILVGNVEEAFGLSSVTYNFDQTLAGTPPSGPTPWLTAAFTDVTPGTVDVTLSALGLTESEMVNQWFFNLNPALNSSALSFTQTGSSGSFASPAIGVGNDSFKAPYDGKYDIMFSFSPAAGSQFSQGDSVTFSITGISGLTASDFLYQNTPSSGHAPLYAAANIQTVGQAVIVDSPPLLPLTVPDGGATVILLGLTLLSLEGARRAVCR